MDKENLKQITTIGNKIFYNKKIENKMRKMQAKNYLKQQGITLIALVVTIVVMLILAGITIQTAIGDGGLIDLANQSKEQQLIATYKDRIGIVGINWSLNRALDDSVTVDDLWQDMQDAGIIEDKDRDVEKLDDNGNYIITVPEGYKFQIHINEYDDVEVEYIGKENNLLPYINEITIISQTTNSVELQVSVSRLNGGTLSYYYKQIDEPDENYQLIKGDTTDLTASITGLTDGTTYEIKIEATNENGTTQKVEEVLIGELIGTITQKGETEWSNGTATIHLETQVSNVSILYQINSTEGTYLSYDDAKGITGLAHGDTVFAVLSDGTNRTDYTSINILDNLPPQNATINLSGQTTTTTGSITATVTHTDNESGIDIGNCRWVYNTNPSSIGTEISSYPNTFNSNGETVTLSASNPATYYLHVLTQDVAGNKTETISQGVTVTQLVTRITLNQTNITLTEGETLQLTATVTPNNASNQNVTWSSDSDTIASVSNTGLITANSAGTATITVRANDGSNVQAICSLTVESSGIPIEDILKEGDYVYYYDKNDTKRKCIVLYGPENEYYLSYGVQIITEETLEDITLGDNNNFNTSMNDYNNAISILNTKAEAYLNTIYATHARSVGSVPDNPSSEAGMYTSSESYMSNYNGMFKDGEMNYGRDTYQMGILSIGGTNNTYWLASRFVYVASNYASFSVRFMDTRGDFLNGGLCSVSGGVSWWSDTHGLRPVFTLNPEIKVTGGNGTSDSPYTLGT